jgi:clan AA aspartic protease (TIGR02281 family)
MTTLRRPGARRLLVDVGRAAAGCEYHPETPATATCDECARRICDPCSRLLPGPALVCTGCRERVIARRWLFGGAKAAGALLAIAGVAVLAIRGRAGDVDVAREQRQQAAPPPIASLDDVETDRLRRAVAREPCDRGRIVELANRLATTGSSREALEAAAGFFRRCGDHPRLRWITYGAHRQLGEWDAAAAEATRLIDQDRYDRDYWGWRGLVYEAKGDHPRAIADYRQALALAPDLLGVPFNLANLYERTGRPCEAIFPLEQFLHHHPAVPNAGQVRQRILALHDSGKCGGYAAKGRAVVEVGGGSPGIMAIVTVNRRHRGRFLIDTGASYVAVSAAFARGIGLETGEGTVLVQTANGPVTARPITLDAVAVQGASAARVSALVMESLPSELDGLLGLSFLSRFELKLNRQRGRLELRAPGHRAANEEP